MLPKEQELFDLVEKLKSARPKLEAREDDMAVESIDRYIDLYRTNRFLSSTQIAFAKLLIKKAG